MNKRLLTLATAAGLAFAGLSGAVATAQNRDAASLRASGQVGEQADGFMGCVAGCDAATRAAVAEINRKRADAYRDVAGRTGVSETVAAQAAGQRLIANLPPGQHYRPLGGGWTRK